VFGSYSNIFSISSTCDLAFLKTKLIDWKYILLRIFGIDPILYIREASRF